MITQCNLYNAIIKNGEPHHTINFHLERLHRNVVTVDYAETILTTCISCGRNMHLEAIAKILRPQRKARLYCWPKFLFRLIPSDHHCLSVILQCLFLTDNMFLQT